ncbi:hypothetical protein TNCT_105461 [Trichonephila clavata]|uniref:Uncharacterized protein n=1 Tax=Trichonephila clavata TaxID=2740835 RepID=A0A8X6JY35_TRICU|nr:hypothetical protein TNCT_105461 [Trichonephila clavata]
MVEILADTFAHQSKNRKWGRHYLHCSIKLELCNSLSLVSSPSAAVISSMHSVARGTPRGGRLLWSLEAAFFSNPSGQPRKCKETPPHVCGITCKKLTLFGNEEHW